MNWAIVLLTRFVVIGLIVLVAIYLIRLKKGKK